MMRTRTTRAGGFTLLELLVSIAILGLVLAGIYGLLDSANRTYLNTRSLIKNQQTNRVVLNYLLFRLRQIDGSGLTKDPRSCKDCHTADIDKDEETDDPNIPCPKDVRIPRRSLYVEDLSRRALPTLDGVDAVYQNLSGYNAITFWADLLPETGMSDEFTDSPSTGTNSAYRNRVWDLTVDEGDAGIFDPGKDREVLYYDLNDNGDFDYYAEKWSFRLKTSEGQEHFQLVESLAFTHTTDEGGTLDVSDRNNSTYPNTGYTDQPVAYGVTGLGIRVIPRIAPEDYPAPRDTKLVHTSCGGGPGDDRDTCHGEQADAAWLNVYQNETAFSYDRFVETHSWWNYKAFSIEVATSDPQGEKFMKMKQVLVPRNFEVNKEAYEPTKDVD